MKKFIIAMLCVAVLFGFAACDNSTSNPADTDTTTSTPVSEATQLRSAAQFVEALLYTSVSSGETATDPIINVADIISQDNVSEFNAKFADGKLTITKTYPEGGEVVGTISVVLSGQYTAPSAADKADGTLNVDDYTVSASDLQIFDGEDYQTVSFSVTAPVKGVSVSAIKADGSAWTYSTSSAAIYAPLPDQTATVTLPVVVSIPADENAKPVTETKTFSDGLVSVLATVLNGNSDPKSFVENVAKTDYLVDLKTAFGTALASTGDIYKAALTTDKVEGLTAAIANNLVKEGEAEIESKVVLTVSATDYVFKTESGQPDKTITGTLTFTFDGKRTKGADTVNLSKLVVTGNCTLAGGDYVIDVVSDDAFPVKVATLSDCSVTVDGDDSKKVTVISMTGLDKADLTGRANIEGITFTLPASN